MNNQKFVALLPLKLNSERVPNKNFKTFAGKPLFSWILEALNETKEISDSLNKFKEMLISAHDINIVTGFGPRYLHSIGQLQKGGPKNVWSIFFYDDNLINHYSEKNNYKDLSDTFKAQMLGDFNALKELEINAYLFNIDSNKPNPFDSIMGLIKE